MVIGMGENKTPEPFRKACDKFTILENLLQEQNPGTTDEDLAHEGLSREKIEDEIIKIVLENQDSNKATGLARSEAVWSACIRILTSAAMATICCLNFWSNFRGFSS